MKNHILRVALPVPLRRCYDYVVGSDLCRVGFCPGMRVRVPFGRHKERIGVVLDVVSHTPLKPDKLKPVSHVIDNEPLFSARYHKLLRWVADYYQHPVGEVLFSALPALLRQGKALSRGYDEVFAVSVTARGVDLSNYAPAQQALLNILRSAPAGLTRRELRAQQVRYAEPLRALLKKGLVTRNETGRVGAVRTESEERGFVLNSRQIQAVNSIMSKTDTYGTHVLQGITGSGKTEVYIEAVRRVIAQNKQALILVPEIGLTPQFIERLRQRLSADIRVQHSALNAAQRLRNWLAARNGEAAVVIGTRSAVWTPLKSPGIYVVDEEHDPSYKQDRGFRYSAKDIAVVRGKFDNVPVVLGSATPSLETIKNIIDRKYSRQQLPARATGANLPEIRFIDLRHETICGAVSKTLLAEIAVALEKNNQTLLFLNRRGYAPVIFCHCCGWHANCSRCSARMTYHKDKNCLVCHQCDTRKTLPASCPDCGRPELMEVGHGTQRLDQTLTEHFPGAAILRIDRDSTRRKGAMEKMIKEITMGDADILIGTQMLAKGHHFPRLTLVGIIDVDAGLLSTDFRASERMAQLLVQVSGRAGRAAQPGVVFIQTHFPAHPLLQTLVEQGYDGFAKLLLDERKQARLPPYSYLALLGAEAPDQEVAEKFLLRARQHLETRTTGLDVYGPVAAPIEKRRGRYRRQLLIQCGNRNVLRNALMPWSRLLENIPEAKRTKWFLDIDPQDLL